MKRTYVVASAIAILIAPVVAQDNQGASAPVSETATNSTDEKARIKAAAKAAKVAAAAERKKSAELKRLYGEGPYPDEIERYLASKPEALKPLYKTLYGGGERNSVLNLQRLGLAAMEQGLWGDAERAFDGALQRIEAIYAKNAQAEVARSTFRKEANKDFKGEPYERSMAFYYRGLLYLRAGDYDNARASFKQAEYQDTISESEEYQSDFAVMNYLVGWTYQCQKSAASASEAFAAAAATTPTLLPPAPDANVLLIAELGRGPAKVRDGTNSEKLIFQPNTAFPENAAKFAFGSSEIPTIAASSVNFQATTRGGRAIDGIMKGKANFKETTGTIGDTAVNLAVSQLSGGDFGGATMGLAAAGAIFSMFSSAAKTDADIRGWDGLPDQINLAATQRLEAELNPQVSYWQGDVATKSGLKPLMAENAGACSVVWSRSQDASSLSADTPGEDAALVKSLQRRKDIQMRDKDFRSQLEAI